jgi:hypothetical protein
VLATSIEVVKKKTRESKRTKLKRIQRRNEDEAQFNASERDIDLNLAKKKLNVRAHWLQMPIPKLKESPKGG